ncbi:unnamed protein product [Clavelina lepadiformis]|uniref:N-acetylneuraminate lyase n=1 Tax=Clavelina lepadiformis TaxID=159417 RepID=A0ABP0FCJ6_CLALP
MKTNKVRGLIAAPFTPMHENGEINLPVIDKYVDLLLEQGVTSVFVNGTTGEGTSLTLEERKIIAEKWIEAGKAKLDKVIIHVGTANLKDSQELARHAAKAGADMIGSMPTFFFRPASIELLVDYLAEIAKVAPDLPLFYYEIPEMTGVKFDMCHMMELAVQKIPNFGGIKFTSFDLPTFARCVDKFADKLSLCYGKDEQLVSALLLGAHAGVGSTYNYSGMIYSRIFKAAKAGNFKEATKDQIFSAKMIGVMFDEGFDVGVNKAVMQAVTGLPVGPPRLPLAAPSKEKIDRIMSRLKEIDFFEKRK